MAETSFNFNHHLFKNIYADERFPHWNGPVVPADANEGWANKYKPTGQELEPDEVDISDVANRFGVDVIEELFRDYKAIHKLRFGGITPAADGKQKLYAATAGAPCNGKSWILDRELEEQSKVDARYAHSLFVDPDRGVMLDMDMYKKLIAKGASLEEAYNICRPASNIIANMLLNEGVKRGFHIAHGTTMTGQHAEKLLKTLGTQGYHRRLIAVDAPLEAREEMRDQRIESEGFYQVTEEDFVKKAADFYTRLSVYFNPALVDDLTLLWKPSRVQPACPVYEDHVGVDDSFDWPYDALAQQYDIYRKEAEKQDKWTFDTRHLALSQLISMRLEMKKAKPYPHPQLTFG